MKALRLEPLLRSIALTLALASAGANVWGAAGDCVYAAAQHGSNGNDIGTGIGGTGTVAKGSGIGGTGIAPEVNGIQRVAGRVVSMQGAAEAHSEGRTRQLAQGGAVCVGETIATSPQGSVKLRMADAGTIELRAATQLRFDKFSYNGNRSDASLFTLLSGSSRIVTGKIGKRNPQNDLLQTPYATIGVLGTDHEATVILSGVGHAAGTYDRVFAGATYIGTAAGRVEIHADQAGYAASAEAMPVLLKELPDFHAVMQSAPTAERNVGKDEHHSGVPAVEHDTDGEAGHPAEHAGHEGRHDVELHDIPSLPEVHAGPELPEAPEVHESPAAPEVAEPPHTGH